MIGLLQIEKNQIRAKILQSLNYINPNSDIIWIEKQSIIKTNSDKIQQSSNPKNPNSDNS